MKSRLQEERANRSMRAVQRWRALEHAAFALVPILEREGLEAVSAGELANAAVSAFETAMAEPLPNGWKKYVTQT